MILVQRVNFDFTLIEVYNEELELIVILLGKVRVTLYKDWRVKNDYRCQDEGRVRSSFSDNRE